MCPRCPGCGELGGAVLTHSQGPGPTPPDTQAAVCSGADGLLSQPHTDIQTQLKSVRPCSHQLAINHAPPHGEPSGCHPTVCAVKPAWS